MHYHVVISGGGLSGVISALALSNCGLKVALIDCAEKTLSSYANDSRVFALSQKSKEILSDFSIWQAIEDETEPILDIFIRDADSPVSAHFGYDMVGENPMGYTVSAHVLYDAICKCPWNFALYNNTMCRAVNVDQSMVELSLTNERILTADLLICAEGKNSQLRDLFSIPVIKYDYQQVSIVCTFIHEKHHENLAVERFFHGGPFAILPMKSGYQSSIIWTEKKNIAEMLMSLSEDEFVVEALKKFGSYLGKLTLSSKRASYPLSVVFAEYLQSKRFLLLGDAAHSLHPIAGQGFNLTLRDIDYIAKNLAKNGTVDITTTLDDFSVNRYLDNLSMAFMTHTINRLFSNKSTILKFVRNAGLLAVENCPKVKKYFINHAMGFGRL